MRPRFEACYFGQDATWRRLAKVCEATALEHCPGWDVRVHPILPNRHRSALLLASNVANTQKLEEWCRLVGNAREGELLLLIDADTAILRPLDDVWDEPFDLAYTVKPGARFPFNGGVLFVRISPAIQQFFAAWWAENVRMLHSAEYHRPFRRRYGGLNQAAFGSLLEQRAFGDLQLRALPCQEWNCEDATWVHFDAAVTRILHVKDGLEHANLRKAIFQRATQQPAYVTRLVELWTTLEAKAQAGARRSA